MYNMYIYKSCAYNTEIDLILYHIYNNKLYTIVHPSPRSVAVIIVADIDRHQSLIKRTILQTLKRIKTFVRFVSEFSESLQLRPYENMGVCNLHQIKDV